MTQRKPRRFSAALGVRRVLAPSRETRGAVPEPDPTDDKFIDLQAPHTGAADHQEAHADHGEGGEGGGEGAESRSAKSQGADSVGSPRRRGSARRAIRGGIWDQGHVALSAIGLRRVQCCFNSARASTASPVLGVRPWPMTTCVVARYPGCAEGCAPHRSAGAGANTQPPLHLSPHLSPRPAPGAGSGLLTPSTGSLGSPMGVNQSKPYRNVSRAAVLMISRRAASGARGVEAWAPTRQRVALSCA